MNRFQFCFNFALNFNLRRYSKHAYRALLAAGVGVMGRG